MVTFKVMEVIVLFVQAILYGMYLASLVHCLRWLVYEDQGWVSRRLEKINWRMLIVTTLFFLLSTASLGIELYIATSYVKGARHHRSAVRKLNNIDIVKVELENAPILITDAFLVYRCWVVYSRRWRVILLPLLLWSSCLTSSFLIAYYYYCRRKSGKPVEYRVVPLSHPAWDVFYSCNIATNIYATVAILYRILSIAKESKDSSGQLYTTCRIFAKFGMMYTLASALSLLGRIVDMNSGLDLFENICHAINYYMPGITFNLIIICVSNARENPRAMVWGTKRQKRLHLFDMWQNLGLSSQVCEMVVPAKGPGAP